MDTSYRIRKRDLSSRQRGSVLLLVLVAIIIMTLTTSSFLLLMRNEHLAAHYSGTHQQTQRLTESGIDYLRVFLSQTTAEIEQQGGVLNNPDAMQDVLVIDDDLASYRGRFTIVASDMSQGVYQNIRYGLENESAKLNLNSLLVNDDETSASDEAATPRDRLMVIPGMNETVADAILDWLDEDDSPRVSGAEADYYQNLATAYLPSNGPIRHLDELLMVQGVTPELLYGVDANRNFAIDPDELPRGALEQLDNSNGELDRGWSAYLTVHSSEANVDSAGEAKLDLNGESLQTLHGELQQALGAAEANFIIAYRQFGPASGDSDGEANSAESVQIDFEKPGETTISSLLDLIGAQVSVTGKENEPPQLINSPWQDDPATYSQGFATLLDTATIETGEHIAGRININQASRPVLLAIPGMTESLAEQILGSREPETDAITGDQRHPTWLLAEGLVTLDELKPMIPYLTTAGDVFRAQVVGFFDAGTARARAEVLIDRSGESPRLLEWKDLSLLGPGFSRTVLSNLVDEID